MAIEDLKQQILDLKVPERIQIVELILESLDEPDLQIQDKWVKESEKRYEAYKAGKLKTYSYQDVLKLLDK